MQKIKKAFLAADQKRRYFYTREGGVGRGWLGVLGAVCGGGDNGGIPL